MYEDTLRQLLGMQAYVLFTYNKAINSILKPISGLRSDSLSIESWKLFKKYEDSTVQFREEIYYNDFLRLINSGSESDMLIRLGKFQKSLIKLTSKYSSLQNYRNYHSSWI